MAHGLTLGGDRDALLEIPQRLGQLVLDLFARLTVVVLPLPLAVHIPEIRAVCRKIGGVVY
jgi:hypothetical protein